MLPSELLGHRPDVVAARWRVEAASRGIDASKAAFKPSINLSAIVGLASAGLSDLFSSDALLGLGGPAISLPIFDGGRLRSQLAPSDADYDLAVASYNQTLVGALHEVTDALQAARSLDAQIASSDAARATRRSRAWDLAAGALPRRAGHAARRAVRATPAAATRPADRRAAGAATAPPPSTSTAPSAAAWSSNNPHTAPTCQYRGHPMTSKINPEASTPAAATGSRRRTASASAHC